MKQLLNVHVARTRNFGDVASAPSRYVKELSGAQRVEIEEIGLVKNLDHCDVVLGGGGIFGNDYFVPHLERLYASKARIAVWGAGTNTHDTTAVTWPDFVGSRGPIGVRDFDCGFEWVPCASCLSGAFDRPRKAKHELVIYEHFRYPIDVPGVPRGQNRRKWWWSGLGGALDFLASGETILTSSYHGAYWGTLLGRRVVAIGYANKFGTLKHSVQQATMADWQSAISRAQAYPGALKECREANLGFSRRVIEFLS